MADSKISNLNELAEAPASTDEFVIVDKSDTSMSASGTTKRIQSQYVTIADATTSVKGKVELATDAETESVTDTARAVTPSNIPSGVQGSIHAAIGKTTPVDADELGLVDSAASYVLKKLTWANVKATLLTYFNTLFPGKDGWQSVSDSWTYASADAPTFTITVPSGAASLYGVGDRIKLTQTTVKYFIVTAVADTVLTVYGGTDYTLANAAISAISYSHMKAPIGFPLEPTKWTVKLTDTTQRSVAGTGGTYNNIGTTNSQITFPIGVWNFDYQVFAWGDRTTAGTGDSIFVTLSTTNNTATDLELTSRWLISGSAANQSDVMAMLFMRSKTMVIATKTLYYLNMKMENSGTWYFDNANATMVLRAVCAYL